MVPRSRLTGRVSLEVGLTSNLRVVAVAAKGVGCNPLSSADRSIGGVTIDYNFGAAAPQSDAEADPFSPFQIDMWRAQH